MKKNSFVFYKDWKEAISGLPDDLRLEIYDSVIEYATSGKVPNLKPMAGLAFNFIKTTIDRDNESYMSSKEQKSASGSLGNLKRWNKDLYDNVLSGSISVEDALKIAESRKRRTATSAITEVANVAVNVSVSDSVSDSEREDAPAPAGNSENAWDLKPIEQCRDELLEDTRYLEDVAISQRLGSIEKAKEWVGLFYRHLRGIKTYEKTSKDFANHFWNWLPYEIIKQNKLNGAKQETKTPIRAEF